MYVHRLLFVFSSYINCSELDHTITYDMPPNRGLNRQMSKKSNSAKVAETPAANMNLGHVLIWKKFTRRLRQKVEENEPDKPRSWRVKFTNKT